MLQRRSHCSPELHCSCRAQSHLISAQTVTALLSRGENIFTHGSISSLCALSEKAPYIAVVNVDDNVFFGCVAGLGSILLTLWLFVSVF